MQLSPGEKLITLLLCDLFEGLKIESDLNPAFLAKAISDGQDWALKQEYSHVIGEQSDVTSEVANQVRNTLEMWTVIEESYEAFSPEQKAHLLELAPVFGKNPKWPGYDGNNEGEYANTAAFMLKEMDYYPRFKERAHLNSHMPTLESSARMWAMYSAVRSNAHMGGTLDVKDVAAILNGRTHPENR